MTHSPVSHPLPPRWRRLVRALGAALVIPLVALVLAGCGAPEGSTVALKPGPKTDALVLDVSESVRASVMTDYYAPAATAFAKAAIDRGTEQLCVAYGGGQLVGGAGQCLPVTHRSGPSGDVQTAQALRSFNAGIAAIGQQRSSLAGGSAVMEMIAAVAPSVGPGSRILVASDMIENSTAVGDFAAGKLRFDDDGRAAILAHLKAQRLLPDLHGVAVIVPYPLMHGNTPSNLDQRRQDEIKQVWTAWAAATGATLDWGGQPDA